MATHPDLIKAAQYTVRARAIHDEFKGRPMPAEAAHEMDTLLKAAHECRQRVEHEAQLIESEQWIAEPQYKRPMSEATPKGGFGIDGQPALLMSKDAVVRLEQKQSVREHLGLGKVDQEAIYGWIGHAVKAQVAPVDRDETERWNKHIGLQGKDMGTGTLGAGGALVPTVIASALIDIMRSRTVMLAAGAKTVPMASKVVQVPKLTGDVTSAWLAEAAAVTPSDATLDQVTLTAKRNEVGPVKISHELNEDSDPVSIGEVVSRSIAAAAALKLDQAALRGSGVAPEPNGVRNQSGVTLHAPGANGDTLTWDLLLTLARLVAVQNAVPNAYLMTPGAAITLAGLKDSQQAYLAPPSLIADVPRLTTTSIPANLTKGTGTALTEVYCGDFTQVLIGLRTQLSLQTLTELYRATGQIGVIARFRADVAVEHGQAFSVATFVDD